jgi:hypothetical protein
VTGAGYKGIVPAQGDGMCSQSARLSLLLPLPLILCALKVGVHLQLPWIHALQLPCSMQQDLCV